MRLLACPYLIVIDDAQNVGTVANQDVFRVTSTHIIPYSKSMSHLDEKQIRYNTNYLDMIKATLNTPYFYFSYTYDLSHSMQRLHNTNPEFLQVIHYSI